MVNDLYEAFGAAVNGAPEPDGRRLATVVAVVSERAKARRRARLAGTAAASALSVGVVGLGAFMLVPSGGADGQQPAAAPTPSADDIEATFPPSEMPTPELPAAVVMWSDVEPGSFLIGEPITYAQEGDADGSELLKSTAFTILPPDGVAKPAGEALGADYFPQAWGDAGVLLGVHGQERQLMWWDGVSSAFVDDAALAEYGDVVAVIGDAAVTITFANPDPAAAESGTADVQTSAALLNLVSTDGATELCSTADSSEPFTMISPDGKTAVCFDPIGAESTDVVVVSIGEKPSANVVTNFTHPADQYTRIGWLSDTELLFARPVGEGYRYFTLNTASGQWEDTFLPGDLDGTLPMLDAATGSYVVTSWGKADVYDADGALISEAACEATVPQVVMAPQRALVTCVDGVDLKLRLVDLATGELIDLGRGASLNNLSVAADGTGPTILAYDPR